jgi:uncharacterized protein YlzI (FlbEa/FlbD family)
MPYNGGVYWVNPKHVTVVTKSHYPNEVSISLSNNVTVVVKGELNDVIDMLTEGGFNAD